MVQSIQNREDASKYSFKFWLMMAIFYAMFIARNVIGISFPVVLYLAWIGVMTLAFEEHELKALLISFIPLYPAFQYKYAIMLWLVIYIIRFFRQIKLTLLIFPGFFLMIWELLHHSIGYFSFWSFIRSFVEILCIMAIMCIAPKKQTNACQISRVLGISSVVAFSILLITTLQTRQMDLFELLKMGFRLGNLNDSVESFKFFYNANGLGYLCNLSIGSLLINFHQKKATCLDGLMISFILFIGLLTTSRTFLLLLILTLSIYVILQDVSIWKKIKTLTLVAVISTVAILSIYLLFPDIIMNYIARFSTEDVSGGRTYLFNFYNEFIFSTPGHMFFGIGMQGIAEKINLLLHANVEVPHNGYQELVVAWGIVGFLLMSFFMVGMIIQAKRKAGRKKIEWIHYLPLLLLLINILAGQFFTASFKMLSLVFVYELLASQK